MPAMQRSTDFPEGLPGAELIGPGLADLASGRESKGSLLIEISRSRLAAAGLPVPAAKAHAGVPELRLYALLQKEHGVEAHYHYGALTQRLEKFCRALEGTSPAPSPVHSQGQF